jgi:hypothetical protein
MSRLILVLAVVLLFALPVFGESAEFKSREVRAALKQYEAKLGKLNEQYLAAQRRLAETYETEAKEIKQGMLEALEEARTKATTADDLDEALKLRNAHKELTETALTPPGTGPDTWEEQRRKELEAFLPGTRWTKLLGHPWRPEAFTPTKEDLVFDKDNYWHLHLPNSRFPWRAVSGHTVETTYDRGGKSVKTFNDERTRIFHIGTNQVLVYTLVGKTRR